MKVLLVNSNRMKPAIAPIGLDYLADSLLAAGHELSLLDLCFAPDPAAAIPRAFGHFTPDVIGLTVRNTDDCYFSGQAFFLPEVKALIGRLRTLSPAPIVLGGVGFSVSPLAALKFCGADFAIAGEGELAFPEFLRAWAGHRGFANVPNLIYPAGRSLRRNPPAPIDLAALPPRRRAFVDNRRYFQAGGQAGFETRRGCPMDCIYCADPVAQGRRVRLLPSARVVAELAALYAQGIDHFHTCDGEFNLPPTHARDICQAIINAKLAEKIRWYAYCAPTPFDSGLAALFKRAGCAGINFGADSACNPMLRRLGRHFTAQDLARTVRLCREHGIPCMIDLLLGGPGETRHTLRRSINAIRRMKPDCVGLSIGIRLYDGTPLARQVRTERRLSAHPHLHGATCGNPRCLHPVFYIAPALGLEITACARELIAGDPRFFLPDNSPENKNYNYNENTVLVDAIQRGARGAYWDILRRMRMGPG